MVADARGLQRHKRARRRLHAAFRPGDPCARCGDPMRAGEDLDADHVGVPLLLDPGALPDALSHARCNRYAGWVLAYLRRGYTPRPHDDPALERVRLAVLGVARRVDHGTSDRSSTRTVTMTRQSRSW